MLKAGMALAVVLQALDVSESTYKHWRSQYGGMKSKEAKRLKQLELENRRLKRPFRHLLHRAVRKPDAPCYTAALWA